MISVIVGVATVLIIAGVIFLVSYTLAISTPNNDRKLDLFGEEEDGGKMRVVKCPSCGKRMEKLYLKDPALFKETTETVGITRTSDGSIKAWWDILVCPKCGDLKARPITNAVAKKEDQDE